MIFNIEHEMNLNKILDDGLTIDYGFLAQEISEYTRSQEYRAIVDAYRYYRGDQDILYPGHGRKELNSEGGLIDAVNAIDKRIVDNQYAIALDKKKNYLFGRSITLTSDDGDKRYMEKVQEYFDRELLALVNETATDSLIAGECYWYPFYRDGELHFQKLTREKCFVFYNDIERKHPHSFIYFYETTHRGKLSDDRIKHIDYYTPNGITRWENGNLIEKDVPYNTINGEVADIWEGRLPLVIWRANPSGRSLFKDIKNSQDALNELKSQIVNNSLEDERTTLLWIENYSGSATDELSGYSLRKKLNDRGIIFTEAIDGVSGGVHVLRIDFEPEKRLLVCEMLKKTIVENMRSFDAKALRDGNPNMLNIRSAYSDMEEDANEMEKQYQKALDELLFFIDRDMGLPENSDADVDFVFNKTMLFNETEKIQNIVQSQSILPQKELIAQHPWVEDPGKVEEEIKDEQRERLKYLQAEQGGGNPYEGMTNENK